MASTSQSLTRRAGQSGEAALSPLAAIDAPIVFVTDDIFWLNVR